MFLNLPVVTRNRGVFYAKIDPPNERLLGLKWIFSETSLSVPRTRFIWPNNESSWLRLNRLVIVLSPYDPAEAWLRLRSQDPVLLRAYDELTNVRHLDRDPLNCQLGNLSWVPKHQQRRLREKLGRPIGFVPEPEPELSEEPLSPCGENPEGTEREEVVDTLRSLFSPRGTNEP